jgi:hypothetical protein
MSFEPLAIFLGVISEVRLGGHTRTLSALSMRSRRGMRVKLLALPPPASTCTHKLNRAFS